MRIALLSWEALHSVSVGGVAVHVTELAAALERLGHEVHVYTRLRWPGDWHYDRIHGVHYHRVPYNGHPDLIEDVDNMDLGDVARVAKILEIEASFLGAIEACREALAKRQRPGSEAS